MPRRRFHTSARRHREDRQDDQDDDSPWGDLDKAFENLEDRSLYTHVYQKHPHTDASSPSQDQPRTKISSAKDPISEMEEAIFAQAGAAAVKSTPKPTRNVGMGALSGVRFSDSPPSASSPTPFGANMIDLGGAAGSNARWSEYMQDSSEDDDSPWSSLDAFVDNPDSSAQFAVPLHLQGQQEVMQLNAQQYAQQSKQSEQPQQLRMNSKEAFAANDDMLRQQIELQSDQNTEEAEFARAGAAAVSQLFNNTQSAEVDANDSHRLSHIDPATNSASMVDVSSKHTTSRSATALGRIYLPSSAVHLLRATESSRGISNKGPVLHTAQLAGIMAAKRTADLIPLCHPLPLTHVEVKLDIVEVEEEESWIEVECTARTAGQTGVEMEALTGCMGACLTVWDMVKAVAGREMRIGEVMVVRKSGGKSGDWERSV
ncbi:Molybdenum cofactor biosynthesis protein C [Pseudozyma hubeiensis]|nr:Molybdenum cofactor biosynthesis protein C [Pseudozyma hubeiensis]